MRVANDMVLKSSDLVRFWSDAHPGERFPGGAESLRGSSGTLLGPETFLPGPIPFYFGLKIFRFERSRPIGGPISGLPTGA